MSGLEGLSEAQLRQLYDEEEVERFISLFSAYVTEIRLSTGTVTNTESVEVRTNDGFDAATGRRDPPPLPPRPIPDRSLSEHIAYDYLLPCLPPATSVNPTFTLKRFTITTQRLYLAMFPLYRSFFLDLARLALWKEYQRSLRYCAIFWFLWFHDLLLPALVFRIIFGLLRRRLSTYPTLKELRERRQETEQAHKFGEAIQQQLSATTIGPLEMWRLFKLYKSGGKDKEKSAMDTIESEEESLKRDALFVLNELTDIIERVKNIFTWRRPDVSYRYLLFLVAIGFGTLILPTEWIVRLLWSLGGALFWHVTPVVAALPREDRIRASILFRDAPTDADYAMELIAKRVATGQEVDVASLRSRSRRNSNASTNDGAAPSTLRDAQSYQEDTSRKKWSERVARGKLFVDESRRFLSTRTSRNLNSGESAVITHEKDGDTYTFLAQYASLPGLITLTPSTLFFTSLTGTRARLIVPRDRLRSVKKSGLLKGILITWVPGEAIGGEEREDKFHWVGDRDELFARLVGSNGGGGRWITV